MNTILDVNALKRVHADMQDPKNWEANGICTAYLKRLPRDMDDRPASLRRHDEELSQLMARWPKSTGQEMYPIPDPYSDDPQAARKLYNTSFLHSTMWDRQNSEYAALRWELLEWLIEQLEEDQGQ